jgi:hypothetical protein
VTVVWDDEMLAFVRKRADEKASAREIANDLCALGHAVTRNAVIGKCNRANIELQTESGGQRLNRGTSSPARKCGPRRRRPKPVLVADGSIAARFVETKSENPIAITELKESTCRWPMGGFADRPPYLYCGDPVMSEGCAYCAGHFGLSIRNKETNDVTTKRAGAAA